MSCQIPNTKAYALGKGVIFVLLLSICSNLPETTSGETLTIIKMIEFNSSSHVHARVSEYLCQLLRSEVLHVFYFSVVNHLIGLSECLSECQHIVGDHTSDLTIVHKAFMKRNPFITTNSITLKHLPVYCTSGLWNRY